MGLRKFLFGSGKVRLEVNDSKGNMRILLVPYEGAPDKEQLLNHVRAHYAVQYGCRATEIKIVAWMHQ